MTSKLGCHWMREHPDMHDIPHIERMQYKSVKLFKPAWDNRDFCNDLLTVLPHDSYILARDHALSEQKEDMWRDAKAAGIDHANQWIGKVHSGQYHLPTDRSFFLGINEPDATDGDRNKIDIYTESFLRRLAENGLRGGAFNFSTGHPRTVDGTPNTKADYTVFGRSHRAIVEGHHIGVLHIYGTGAVPCAPGHFDRLGACEWQDVEWVVGEFGIDSYVIGGGEHFGFHKFFDGRLNDYCGWLDTAIMGVNDPRIHSYQVFTYDFAHPWDEFDIHPIRAALESYDWQHVKQAPIPPQPPAPPVKPIEPVPPVAVPQLTHPVADPALRIISQRFGENPQDYAKFGLAGHPGLDFAVPVGTPVVAVDDGVVVEAQDNPDGYGLYVKLRHAWGESLYAHLAHRDVSVGAIVSRRVQIGLSGNSGNSTGPHLHFAIRINPYQRGAPYDGYSDPLPYLPSEATAPGPFLPGQPSPSLPTREPVRESCLRWFKQYGEQYAVEWHILAALAFYETKFDSTLTSNKGAQGLMQFTPATWQDMKTQLGATDPFDPEQSIKATAYYLSQIRRYLIRFQRYGWQWVLAGYNAGMGNASKMAWESLPPETKIYVDDILHLSLALQRWEDKW